MTREAGPTRTAAGIGADVGGADVGVRLVSGDGIEMDIRFARLGSRAFARMLDFGVQLVLGLVAEIIGNLVGSVVGTVDTAVEQAITVVVVVVVLLAYPILMETFGRGRTLGKLAMGLRVVRDDGGPIRFRQAMTRALVGFSAEFPGLLPPFTWFASLTAMLTNPAGKRLGDIAAGTIVIHDRSPETWGWVPSMPPQLAPWAETLDLTGFSDQLALAVRNYLSRNRKLREPARTRLGIQLAAETAGCVTPPAPPNTAGWAYLAAVLAERHRRSVARIGRARTATAAVWPELARLTTTMPTTTAPTLVSTPVPPVANSATLIRAAVPDLP